MPSPAWIAVALAALAALVYIPILWHGFLNWDDPEYVTQNPAVLGGLTWHGFIWALTSIYASNWHPLTWVSHMLDVQLYGLNPGGHHLTSVVLHVLSAVLLFGLLPSFLLLFLSEFIIYFRTFDLGDLACNSCP